MPQPTLDGGGVKSLGRTSGFRLPVRPLSPTWRDISVYVGGGFSMKLGCGTVSSRGWALL